MGEKRLLRTERRLDAAEAEYVSVLETALHECAAGRWGLFGQNDRFEEMARYAPPELGQLEALAEEVEALRAKLGHDPFPLHARFKSMRGRGDGNRPGEPKLAAQLLVELRPSPR